MPYEFDWEFQELIMEIRGIHYHLLDLLIDYANPPPHVSINHLAISCIIQSHEIQEELTNIRLALLFEMSFSLPFDNYDDTRQWLTQIPHLKLSSLLLITTFLLSCLLYTLFLLNEYPPFSTYFPLMLKQLVICWSWTK